MGSIARASAWVGAVACIVLMALVVANVILRFTWKSIPGTLDVTESLMLVITVMMLAYTQIKRGHVKVEFFTNFLPAKPRQGLGLFTLILALGFTTFLTWQSWRVALLALRIQDASGTPPFIPFYPAKLILAIGISILCLQLIFDVWQETAKLFRRRTGETLAASSENR
ncbi:MAG TPA: TRAP transporter small permease [Dehalococcoidales bacterium]|nr:TRAP transporter small permease [Dehalococcoidales bacterium]